MLNTDEFSIQIRRAMENLHDFAYLERLPIVRAMSSSDRTAEQSVRRLRSELLDIIDRLKPADDVPARSKGRRPYELLYGRYVQCMSTEELVQDLAISLRQLRREQKRAIAAAVDLARERLGDVLEAMAPVASPLLPDDDSTRWTAADQEVEQLIQHATVEAIGIPDLIRTIGPVLDALAGKHNATVQYALPEHLPVVYADRVVVRQALLGLLSMALDRSRGGSLKIAGATAGDDQVVLQITVAGAREARVRAGIGLAVSEKLLHSVGAQLDIQEPAGQWQAQIRFPAADYANIVLVDDNAGLIQLFRRYLAGQPRYRIYEAGSGREVVERAQAQPLHLIILDVMMPGQDGWELLQILRGEPATARTPIMVCSVLNEPQIAFALGASDYLNKPVTQNALLLKVERWCSARPAPAAAPPPGRAESADSR